MNATPGAIEMTHEAEQSAHKLLELETKPPQGTTWAVFAVLVVIAHTLLRIEAKMGTKP